jgi:iron-sulfur cluster insertion protein
MVTITSNAIDKITDILAEENNPKLCMRVLIEGGGCSGFQYKFRLDEEQNEDDFVIVSDNVKVLIDHISMQYLENATLDYQDELFNSGFVMENPNVRSTCGCGASFNPL